MTSDGVMVLAHGQVFDRQAVVDSLAEAPLWRTYDIADEQLIALSNDHAILVYTGRAYRDEDEPAFIARHAASLSSTGGVPRTQEPVEAARNPSRPVLGHHDPPAYSTNGHTLTRPHGDRSADLVSKTSVGLGDLVTPAITNADPVDSNVTGSRPSSCGPTTMWAPSSDPNGRSPRPEPSP